MRWLRIIRKISRSLSENAGMSDARYGHAMQLTDEVSDRIRERAGSKSPFRTVLAEMLLGRSPDDPALIADAFQVTQEARIFHGPPNGKF